jgi:hypothetical protein
MFLSIAPMTNPATMVAVRNIKNCSSLKLFIHLRKSFIASPVDTQETWDTEQVEAA